MPWIEGGRLVADVTGASIERERGRARRDGLGDLRGRIAWRAGRKGFDDKGFVVVEAPEHVIENLRLSEKAARHGKKVVKRKPSERNFVNWDLNTFKRADRIAARAARLAVSSVARDAAECAEPEGRRLSRDGRSETLAGSRGLTEGPLSA